MKYSNACGVQLSDLATIIKHGFPYEQAILRAGPITPSSTSLSLRSLQSPVQDQAQGDFCVSFAVAACAEFVVKNGRGNPPVTDIHLSEAHINHAAETRHGDCTPGVQLWQALEAVSYFGVVTAEVWPYDQTICCYPSPPDRGNATWYQIRNWRLFNYVEHAAILRKIELYSKDIKPIAPYHSASLLREALIRKQAPVLIDIPVTVGNGWDFTGDITMPSAIDIVEWLKGSEAHINTPPGTRGWHAICVTGFDDDTMRFEFKNSWGTGWGKGGYGTLPFEYVSAFNRQMWDSFDGYYNSKIGPFPSAI